ncbi:MAG TPA: hypothetical protein VGN73_11640 [Gemmatimonadaceae bacterium]|jgi:hypothetical protein|nr:hypothetical protein [Gemmatimonadaceae bacterium]
MSKTDSFFNPDQYATVAERIELFYSRFPQGRINTELVARHDGEITFKALVYRGADETLPAATGWASEREGDSDINTTSCLENTETSAVGRALANLGFTASSKRPSREEMDKAVRVRNALAFRERTSRENASLHSLTHVTDDVLRILALAEHNGFPLQRSAILRDRVRQPGLSASRVRKIENSLRAWVRRHEM